MTVTDRIVAARLWIDHYKEIAKKTERTNDTVINALIVITMTQQTSDYLADIDPQALKQCQLVLSKCSWENFVVDGIGHKLQEAWDARNKLMAETKSLSDRAKVIFDKINHSTSSRNTVEAGILYEQGWLLHYKSKQMRSEAEIQWLETIATTCGQQTVVRYDNDDCVVDDHRFCLS